MKHWSISVISGMQH